MTTADGSAVPVKWIGRQAIGGAAGMPEGREPVRISAGALGDGLPLRDLVVTSDHAMLLDGVLVQAGALVNGSTIARLSQSVIRDGLTVFHIETKGHEIILAEGAATETFVDNVTRRAFDNFAEFEALYGATADAIAERDEPRAMSPRQVPAAIRDRIAIAAGEGLAQAA
ncbi:Hint domain-containing protein [Chenggangzhangella methanolivorans]|uniref:Hint domain-containing protein n=1 Tax=Chenggangzhangella methanolivorans TaxID=1437009 RepID=A0A9E6RDT7_9HYPH|nr:Hint domain-containing protein [Chenggangzhangella methanolivorans]